MTEEEVVHILGDPKSRRTAKGKTTLRYTEVYSPGVCRPFVFLIPIGPSPATKTRLHVEFEEERLTDAWTEVVSEKGKPVQWVLQEQGAGPTGG
jgi:hypothetical protein